MWAKHHYSRLNHETDEEVGKRPLPSLLRWIQVQVPLWLGIVFVVSNVSMFVTGFLVAYFVLFTSQAPSPTAPAIRVDNVTASVRSNKTAIINGIEVAGTQCGSNWQEAKAMGCHFDVMASRWYSTECFDQEVLDDMLAEPQVNWNFTWYEDHEHTIVVPPEKVFMGEFDKVYPDNLFHIKHCLHLWRKLHHAVLTSRPVDEDILDYNHTKHCTKMIMNWTSPGFQRHSVTTAKSATPFCRSAPVGLLDSRR